MSTSHEQLGLPYREVTQVEDYWQGLRNGRLMPTRAEVDPRGIPSALEFAFILERIAPGMARIRVAGMHLNDILGMEVRGMPITALIQPAARRDMQNTLEAVFDLPATAVISMRGDSGLTRPKLSARMFLAPLKSREGARPRLLGAFKANGQIGRSPRRFDLTACDLNPLSAAPVHAFSKRKKPARAFAEPVVPFQAAAPLPGVPTKVAYLRLITREDGT